MSKSKLLKEAMAEAQELRKAAIQNAQNVLAEAIQPKIKEFIDSQLGEADIELEAGGQGKDEEEEEKKEFPPEMKEEEMYEVAPQMQMQMPQEATDTDLEFDEKEEDEEDKDMDEMRLKEGEDEEEKKEDEEEVEEVVELTAEDLQKALSEVLKEATVTKNFGDAQDPTPKSAGGKGEKGIAGNEKEGNWNEQEAPASEDWTVKEAKMTRVIRGLDKELKEYKSVCSYLKSQLKEVALFNNKLLYTNKVLQSMSLNNKQRSTVVEMFDNAKTMDEVKLVYKTLHEGFKIAGVVSESKKKTSVKSKSSSVMSPSQTLIKEGREMREENSWVERQKVLAGLVK